MSALTGKSELADIQYRPVCRHVRQDAEPEASGQHISGQLQHEVGLRAGKRRQTYPEKNCPSSWLYEAAVRSTWDVSYPKVYAGPTFLRRKTTRGEPIRSSQHRMEEIMKKNRHALDTGLARVVIVVIMGMIASLDRFPSQPEWETSVLTAVLMRFAFPLQ